MTFAFRAADLEHREERHFIVDSWVRSFQFAHAAGVIAVEKWFEVMIPEVERLLTRPGSRTIVAYRTGQKDRLADLQGFITVDTDDPEWGQPIVHYVFVKEPYRGAGLARGLFAAASVDPQKPFLYTATTGAVSKIYQSRKIPFARWDPLIARFAKEDPRRPRRRR